MRALLLVVFVLSVVSSSHATPPGYKLIWSDEFSGTGKPDPKKWSYEVGFLRNHESQYYTDSRLENCRIENGHLIIEGRKEAYTPDDGKKYLAPVAHYTAASINTQGKFTCTYGRIEVRAKLPAGKGAWPAIWTLGANEPQVHWPRCGEIDIMELVGKEPGIIHGTVHYFDQGQGKRGASAGSKLAVENTDTKFHVYSTEWTPARIDLFVDDQKYFSFDLDAAVKGADNPFRKPHYILLNLALGGDWGGPVIDDSIFPSRFEIDYVRVYQK